MGEGGVACVPSYYVMERLTISDSFCSVNGNFASNSVQFSEKLEEFSCKEVEKDIARNGKCSVESKKLEEGKITGGFFIKELNKHEFNVDKLKNVKLEKEQLNEFHEKTRERENGDVEIEEVASEGPSEDVENGEFVPEDLGKVPLNGKELATNKLQDRELHREREKGEIVTKKWREEEIEKGEFVPEKWRNGRIYRKCEEPGDELTIQRVHRKELAHDISPKKQRDFDESSGNRFGTKNSFPFSDGISPRKEAIRSIIERPKWNARWVEGHDRESRNSSRHSDVKNHSKRHTKFEFDNHKDNYSSKTRRNYDEDDWYGHSGKSSSRFSPQRSSRNSSSFPRISSSNRHSSRNYDSFSSSKGSHGRHGHHTDYYDCSPHQNPRHFSVRDSRDRSPTYFERTRHHDQKDRGHYRNERSPRDRGRVSSPRDRGRRNDCRESIWSPRDHYRETSQSSNEHGQVHGNSESIPKSRSVSREGRSRVSEPGLKDSQRNTSSQKSPSPSSPSSNDISSDKIAKDHSKKEHHPQNTSHENVSAPDINGVHEELLSMEEDMDICDTPPHVPASLGSTMGKWYYLDYDGNEQGPSKLCDLRKLVADGILQTDHFVKHSETNRWVTIENAASPLVPLNFVSIVSDSVTQLVNPPEASGNLLIDTGDVGQTCISTQSMLQLDDATPPLESNENLHIDARVDALLEGHTLIPGRELEIVGEALHVKFEDTDFYNWGLTGGFPGDLDLSDSSGHFRYQEFGSSIESVSQESTGSRTIIPYEKVPTFFPSSASDWFASRWSFKGGDWKRNDEVFQDRSLKKKLVLNDGYALCLMAKSGNDDPRWLRKDELYHSSRVVKLDLPPWSFCSDDKNDNSRPNQGKLSVTRGVKGVALPVVRINACVVKDHGSLESASHTKARGNERYAPRPSRHLLASNIMSTETNLASENISQKEPQNLCNSDSALNILKEHVCTVDELQLHLGDWYYIDGFGREHGPSSVSDLQDLVSKGVIMDNSSVYRKTDKIWVPVNAVISKLTQEEKDIPIEDSSSISSILSQSFHGIYPQFIGYTRGKLHELVMKSYRSRDLAAAINEVLDPWISAKQPKKEIDRYFPVCSTTKGSAVAHDSWAYKIWKSEDDWNYKDQYRGAKRTWIMMDGSEEDYEIEEELLTRWNDCSFDDLVREASSTQYNDPNLETIPENWNQLSIHILARVFHFLRTDLKSLAFSAATCKNWSSAVKLHRNMSLHVDLSSLGAYCSDSIFQSIIEGGYDKSKLTSVALRNCVNINSIALEEFLQSCSSISFLDVRGCNQFDDLLNKFQNIKRIKGTFLYGSKVWGEFQSKTRNLKFLSEKTSSRVFKSPSSYLNDTSDHDGSPFHESSLDRKDSLSHVLQPSSYKRSKVFGARKPSSHLSIDSRMRRLLQQKAGTGYKRMEEFLSSSLREIMRKNSFEFFIPKVAKIENRMRNGYYVNHGFNSVKEDLGRMCRDAIKAKSRVGDMNHIVMLFIRLVASLEENFSSSFGKDDTSNASRNPSGSGSGFSSSFFKDKKKTGSSTSEKRTGSRSNTFHPGGTVEFGDYASDREIRRRLSKLNKRTLDSESETSDSLDLSEDDVRGNYESTSSESEEMESQLEDGTGYLSGNINFVEDDAFPYVSDDREWGARMTKESLVPPVTRKYEVIERYVAVADEEEVLRKMRVALPDDYDEKLLAQKNSSEDLDMEIPEVKEYKPRKFLGVEVIEQEVYGIDPYTHNLLLDSMPEALDWSLLDKHHFIEEALLRTLNKQVRYFTGTGNTPMEYPLQPVIEEILRDAEVDGNERNSKMCRAILKSIHERPDDNYVAYRKGLGVVCNTEDGFPVDDFVVEFLGEVYPAWKWFEKQDGIRSLQKNNKDPAPEFYNIYLERPKGDRDGYDLVVVDAMHKANYASRVCHSCKPNCEAKVTAVDGQYQIGIYTVRPICYGEEITFDYNSVTESKEEYEASVCLCGNQVCRGSYLNLTGEGAFQKVLKECHGILDRHQLMFEACEVNSVSSEDYNVLGRAGLGTCLLDGLPGWLIAYAARLVRFINFERTKLPEEILRHNVEEKRKFFSDVCVDSEKVEAEIQAEGVYNQRLQNLALTIDKVRYVTKSVFGDPKKAPPPLKKLSPEAAISYIWKGEGSLVDELLQCMDSHMDSGLINDLKSKIRAHDPSGSNDPQKELRKSLLWLRDEIRDLPCTYKCRHDAAADLIHMYAYTKGFFRVREYKSIKSPPVYISPLDVGPKYAEKLGSDFQEYCKTYGPNYCLGQLIYWHNQANPDPDCNLARARRGCLSLPDASSFYAKPQMSARKRIYGPRTLKFMLSRMEKQPQKSWPKDRIWTFKNNPKILGSPMMDAVLNKTSLDREMMHWLKNRPSMFQATWDR